MIRRLENFSFEDKLRVLRLFSVEKKRIQGRPAVLKEGKLKSWRATFYRVTDFYTVRHGFKINEGIFILDIRKKFVTHRHSHRLPREAMDTPSLKVCKDKLNGAVGSLIYWVAVLPMAGRWNWLGFKVPSKPTHSVFLQYLYA